MKGRPQKLKIKDGAQKKVMEASIQYLSSRLWVAFIDWDEENKWKFQWVLYVLGDIVLFPVVRHQRNFEGSLKPKQISLK